VDRQDAKAKPLRPDEEPVQKAFCERLRCSDWHSTTVRHLCRTPQM